MCGIVGIFDGTGAGARRTEASPRGPDAAGWRPAPGPRLGRVEQSGPKVCEAPRVFRPYRSLAALVRDSLEGDFHGISLWPDGHGRRLVSPQFRRDGLSSALKMLRHRAAREPLSVAHILDQQSDRPGDGLIQVDHAGWVPGFQGRDHALVAWVSSLSPRLKLHGEEGKYLFNTSLGPYSPDRVRYRGKMGCAVAAWFRGPFRQKLRKTGVSPVMAQGFARSFLGPRLDPHRADIRDPSAGPWSAPMDQPFLRGNPSPSATA